MKTFWVLISYPTVNDTEIDKRYETFRVVLSAKKNYFGLRSKSRPPSGTERQSERGRMKKEKKLNASTWEKAKPASSSGWMAGRARKVQRVRESKQVILLRRVTCDCFELSGCAWEREKEREKERDTEIKIQRSPCAEKRKNTDAAVEN